MTGDQFGGAVGLAIANSILNNIFLANLPTGSDSTLRERLRGDLKVIDELPSEQREGVLDACASTCLAAYFE